MLGGSIRVPPALRRTAPARRSRPWTGEPGTAGTVTVVGAGKMGLPLAAQFASHGWHVIAVDVEPGGRRRDQRRPVARRRGARARGARARRSTREGRLRATLDGPAAAARGRRRRRSSCRSCSTTTQRPDYRHHGRRRRRRSRPAIHPGRDRDLRDDAAGRGHARPVRADARGGSPASLPTTTSSSRSRPSGCSRAPCSRTSRRIRSSSAASARDRPTAPPRFYASVLDAEIVAMSSAEAAELASSPTRPIATSTSRSRTSSRRLRGCASAWTSTRSSRRPTASRTATSISPARRRRHCIPVYPHFLLSRAPVCALVETARAVNDGQVDRAVGPVAGMLGALVGVPVLVLGADLSGRGQGARLQPGVAADRGTYRRRGRRHRIDPLSVPRDRISRRHPWAWGTPGPFRVVVTQTGDPRFASFDPAWCPALEILYDGRNSMRGVELPRRRHLCRRWRPGSHPYPSSVGGPVTSSAGDRLARPSVVALVHNDLTHDSRVRNEAATLASAGWQVVVVAVADRALADRETIEGFEVIRHGFEPEDIRLWRNRARISKPWRYRRNAARWVRRRFGGEHGSIGNGLAAAAAVGLVLPWVVLAYTYYRAMRLGDAVARAFDVRRPSRVAARWVEARAWQCLLIVHRPLRLRDWGRRIGRDVEGGRLPVADVWHAHDLETLPIALGLAGRFGGHVVYDVHEIFVEAAGRARLGRVRRAMLRLAERRWAGRATAVVTVNDAVADELVRRYRIAPPLVVRNCPPKWAPQPGIASPLQMPCHAHGRPDAAGGHRTWDLPAPPRIPTIACRRCSLPGINVVFLGYGGQGEAYRALAAAPPWRGRLAVLPAVPPRGRRWRSCRGQRSRACLIQPTTLNHRLSTPNKLFEAIAAGVPVLAADLPAIASIVRASGGGILVDPTHVEAIRDGLAKLLADEDLLSRLATDARASSARELNWNIRRPVSWISIGRWIQQEWRPRDSDRSRHPRRSAACGAGASLDRRVRFEDVPHRDDAARTRPLGRCRCQACPWPRRGRAASGGLPHHPDPGPGHPGPAVSRRLRHHARTDSIGAAAGHAARRGPDGRPETSDRRAMRTRQRRSRHHGRSCGASPSPALAFRDPTDDPRV